MDEYIAMCDAAMELKKNWKPQAGDRFYVKNDLYFSIKTNRLSAVREEVGDYPYYGEGIYYLGDNEKFGEIDLGYGEYEYDPETLRLHSVFLPSQEQLQALITRGRFMTNSSLMTAFGAFCFKEKYGRLIRTHSLTQLWLMFYYFEIHNKIWDGEKFVKVDKGILGEWN